MYKILFFCSAFTCYLSATFAQTGIVKEKIYHPDSAHSAHKAVTRSLMLPGWGQAYNHRAWKVPLIYGGLSALVINTIHNQQYYHEYLTLSRYRNVGPPKKGDPYYSEYIRYSSPENYVSDGILASARENARRNRDICIISILGIWGIQAIDAYIDAKMIHSYTVDNNLSFKITPGILNQQLYTQGGAAYSFVPCIKVVSAF
ncbi:DUF5683 domain-containing protein [Mucilaginibacter kameinonensis]|uniref:DUF5683 domain-containing protein n=1 Tax=Mucilaginibacter kameinonensis TaxID=452286 RepID=UPI000EF80352|nr:DUF5683 domain-containing protein [Mucilaginibacter kameinonensis]